MKNPEILLNCIIEIVTDPKNLKKLKSALLKSLGDESPEGPSVEEMVVDQLIVFAKDSDATYKSMSAKDIANSIIDYDVNTFTLGRILAKHKGIIVGSSKGVKTYRVLEIKKAKVSIEKTENKSIQESTVIETSDNKVDKFEEETITVSLPGDKKGYLLSVKEIKAYTHETGSKSLVRDLLAIKKAMSKEVDGKRMYYIKSLNTIEGEIVSIDEYSKEKIKKNK